MSRKYASFLSFILIVAAVMTGCGGAEVSGEEVSVSNAPPRQAIDWDTYRMAQPQQAADGSQWYLAEYHDDWLTSSDEGYRVSYQGVSASCGNIYYKLQYYSDSDSQAWDYVDLFDAQTGQSFHIALDPAQWGLPEDAWLLDVDMVDDQRAVFLFRSRGKTGSPLSCCTLVSYHLTDGLQNTLDLLPALAEAGITEETELLLDSTKKSFLCDPNGYSYLFWDEQLLVISDAGELLCQMGQDGETMPSYLCKTAVGFPIFTTKNRNDPTAYTYSYRAYDPVAGEMRSLGTSPVMTLRYSCMDDFGDLYYFEGDKIVRWNTLSGQQENIFDCSANDICPNLSSLKVMTVRENGDLVIMDDITQNKNIYVLSPDPPEIDTTLTLDASFFYDPLVESAAARFSMKHPGVRIEYSNADSDDADGWNDFQAYTNRLIDRIVAGDAPDMFIVSAENMQILYEKGALADLSGVIPPETQEQVFGGVWNAGTIDGKLIGLATRINVSSILVSDDIWPYDTWTLEDILTLADHASADTLKGLVPLSGSQPLASDVLEWLALSDLDSSLVDRGSGVCHFDSPQFRRLLEYCKNTPIPEPDPNLQNTAPAQAVRDGEYLAYACSPGSFMDFSFTMSLFPENYHWVGIPTQGESGALSNVGAFLVVSRDTENMNLIREFLPTVYDYDLARQHPRQCLRKDVFREQVFVPGWASTVQFSVGEGRYLIVEGKPDGTSYAEDYIALLDSSVPQPPRDSVIADIVLEEVAPYFAGDKDIDTVIKLIQNRVQLYLYENSP